MHRPIGLHFGVIDVHSFYNHRLHSFSFIYFIRSSGNKETHVKSNYNRTEQQGTKVRLQLPSNFIDINDNWT